MSGRILVFTSGHCWGDADVCVTVFRKSGVAVNTLASKGFNGGVCVGMSTTEGTGEGIGVLVLDGSVTDADGKDTFGVVWGVEQETQTMVIRHNRKAEVLFSIAIILCDLPK